MDSKHLPVLLSYAIEVADEERVRVLLRNGADPNKRDAEGVSPLHLAFRTLRFQPKVVRTLWEGGAVLDLDSHQSPELLDAMIARYPRWPIVIELLLTVERDHPLIQTRLVELLRKVALSQHAVTMRALLRRFGPIAPTDLERIFRAANWQGNLDTMRAVEEAGAGQGMRFIPPDRDREPLYTALHDAAQLDDSEKVRLLASQIPVDVRDEMGGTPLMHAIEFLRPNATQTLLDLGADPNLRDVFGRNAADYLARALADILFNAYGTRAPEDVESRERAFREIRAALDR